MRATGDDAMPSHKNGSYGIVKNGRNSRNGVFREVRMPDGSVARAMNKGVFDRAVNGADLKIRSSIKSGAKKETAS